jgi:photosynthetic reaction center cytochrome c subunit
MSLIPSRSAAAVAAAVLGFFATVGLSHTPVVAQSADQTMEDVFENITHLRGMPADQMFPTMVYFEAALGVGCGYCHEGNNTQRDLDDNPKKDVAREMIDLVNVINESFEGEREVTCFTCHNGRPVPIGTPNVTGESLPVALGEDYIATLPAEAPVSTVSASQVLDNYLAAFGGMAAFQNVPSLTATGTVTQLRTGRPFPGNQIEITSKAPGMQVIATQAGQNENLTAYNANDAWAKAGNADAMPGDLRAAQADAMKLEDIFNLPVQLKQLLIDPQIGHPEVIKGREMYVVTGHTENLPRVDAYFEKENGMLARLVYFIETPIGPYPTQIEYRDYREVEGRKVPYSWVISHVRNREYTWAMRQVRAVTVDDAMFARPAGDTP